MAAIITPSWLKVERAIIFFKSVSNIAEMPAINIVAQEITSKVGQKKLIELRNGKNRIRRKTPAVTSVDE